jgi:hypothetical protein
LDGNEFSMKKNIYLVSTLLLIGSMILMSVHTNFAIAQTDSRNGITYLPLVDRNPYTGFRTDNKFIGIYMHQYWTDSTVATWMPIADNLANKKHTVSGWFIDIQDSHFAYPGHPDLRTNNLYRQLEALWKKGYISFVNINSTATAYAIASGQLDTYLGYMAEYYADWVRLGGGRRAFLAPLPEMNGVNANGLPWTSYGGDPINFKLAYQHIQNIFAQKGVSRDQVWWVFAPNGWSKAGHEFEIYYPGDNIVDVVGFSMYNFGFCQVALPWPRWENYNTLYEPYLSRIHNMAPGKPIIIAQTGTTAEYQWTGEFNVDAKNTWLRENYEYLSNQPQVLGILYFDIDKSSWECNWAITGGDTFKAGYSDGAAFPVFQYLSGVNLQSIIP